MNYFEMKKKAFMDIVNSLKGFIRTVSGVPPLTLPDCVDGDSLVSYSIEGDGVGDKTKNLSQTSPIHKYDYSLDYGRYNSANIAVLTAGIYTISTVSGTLPMIQFFNMDKQIMVYTDAIELITPYRYYGTNNNKMLMPNIANVKECTFRVITEDSIIMTMAGYYGEIDDLQVEEGNTASEYELYGYKIPVKVSGENINPVTTNIYLDAPLTIGDVLEYPKNDIPKLPTVKGTTIYSVETEVRPTNMSVEYYSMS